MGCCCWTGWCKEASGGEAGGRRGRWHRYFKLSLQSADCILWIDGGPWKALGQSFSTGDDFVPYTLFPGDTWQHLKKFLAVTTGKWEGAVLLAFSGQRPGMLPNFLNVKDSPTQWRIFQNVNSAELEKSALGQWVNQSDQLSSVVPPNTTENHLLPWRRTIVPNPFVRNVFISITASSWNSAKRGVSGPEFKA